METTVLVLKNQDGDIVLIRGRFSISGEPDPQKLSSFERCVAATARKKGLTVSIEPHFIPDPAQ